MKEKKVDCIVVGLGAMGSSTAYHLSKNRIKVLGLEQFQCAHNRGSSHGETRLIRKAYFEHPDYVPLLERSYELWRELEERLQTKVLYQTGLVIFGDPETSQVLSGVRTSALKYEVSIEEWDSTIISKRFPQARVPSSLIGLYEPTGGYLEVEHCVEAHCEAAKSLGAELHFNEKVISWEKRGASYQVRTDRQTYTAEKIVFTAGAWLGRFLPKMNPHLKVHRAPLFWFASNGSFKKENGVPCFAFDLPEGFFYGFTESQSMIKLALHQPLGIVSDPDSEERVLREEEGDAVRSFVNKFLPGVNSQEVKSDLCFYTMSPDTHFIIDQVPGCMGAFFAGGFSGHGFKFSSAVGEVLSDWVIQGKSSLPTQFLSAERFQEI